MKKLGITGGIAMGKSTVLKIIQDQGIEVFSCDDAARKVWHYPNTVDLLERYRNYRSPKCEITREIVRDWMLDDSFFKRKLEAVMLPPIIRQMQASSAQVVEAPLLFEAGLRAEFETVWLIHCDPETQLDRLVARVNDKRLARRLIEVQSQTPMDFKFIHSDKIISTDCTIDALTAKVTTLLSKALSK